MDGVGILILVAGVLIVALVGAVAWVFLAGSDVSDTSVTDGLRGLMSSASDHGSDDYDDVDVSVVEEIKRQTGSSKSKKSKEDLSRLLFKAGYFTAEDHIRFNYFRIICLLVCVFLFPGVAYFVAGGSAKMVLLAGVFGLFAGFAYPKVKLNKIIEAREEDIMYYLPLVIEQVSIGVSSSLDIGPCLNNIVEMANERDSHNPVTEMFVHVEKLIRSGLNLEDSLSEVAEANGMTEVKHAFMFLAQCARHGGEVSKQLQELADSVMSQRQVQVEARITALPVKATGPLGLVFAGFFALLFSGLFVQLLEAFKPS